MKKTVKHQKTGKERPHEKPLKRRRERPLQGEVEYEESCPQGASGGRGGGEVLRGSMGAEPRATLRPPEAGCGLAHL